MNNNTIELKVEIANYDEIIEKLKTIKKLLDEISKTNIQIEVK